MRTEILILLMSGFKPNIVSKILDIPIDTVYYNKRALIRGYEVIEKLDLEEIKERLIENGK